MRYKDLSIFTLGIAVGMFASMALSIFKPDVQKIEIVNPINFAQGRVPILPCKSIICDEEDEKRQEGAR